MVEEDAHQHLQHFSVELKREVMCQDQLEETQSTKNAISLPGISFKKLIKQPDKEKAVQAGYFSFNVCERFISHTGGHGEKKLCKAVTKWKQTERKTLMGIKGVIVFPICKDLEALCLD